MINAILSAGKYEIKMGKDGHITATPIGKDYSMRLDIGNHQVTFRPEGRYSLEATEQAVVLKITDSKFTLKFTITPISLAKETASSNSIRWNLHCGDIAEIIGDSSSGSLLEDIRKTITIE